MLTFPHALKIYLAVEPVDMRAQFNGLWAYAEQTLRENPRGGVDDAPGRDRPSKTAAKKRGTRAERVSAGASLAFGDNVPTLEQALGQITTLQQEMAVLRAQIEWFKDL